MATQDERTRTLRTTSPSNIFPQSHSTGRSPYVSPPVSPPNPMREQLIAQIPTGDVQPPARFDPVQPQNEMVNTANALGPLAGGAARGIVGLGRLAAAANTGLRGAPAAAGLATGAGVVANEAAQMASAPTAPAAPAAAPLATQAQVRSVDNAAMPGAAAAPQTLRNNILRVGNSYSSADGGPITEGATINGQQRGNLSVVPGGPGAAGVPASPVSLRGAMPGANDGGRWNGAMYRTGDQLRRDAEVQASSIVPGTRRQGEQALAAQNRQQGIETEAGARLAGQLGSAEINAESNRYGADQRLRGDLVQAQTQRATNQARLSMQAMQNDRQYSLDVARLGADRAKTEFSQRQEAEKGLVSRLETMNTAPGKDGKPVVNSEAVARQRTAVQSYLNNQIEAAEKAGDTATADVLRRNGVGAISEDRLNTLVKQLKLQDISRAEHSNVNPRGGTNVESDPEGYTIVGRENRLLRPDVYSLRNGGVVPVNAVDRPGSTLGWGGSRSTEFDQLKRLRNGAQ